MDASVLLGKETAQYLPQLNVKQKKTLLTVVKTFIGEQKDWWDEIDQEQQAAIDKALVEMQEGRLTPHNEVMKKYKKWLK